MALTRAATNTPTAPRAAHNPLDDLATIPPAGGDFPELRLGDYVVVVDDIYPKTTSKAVNVWVCEYHAECPDPDSDNPGPSPAGASGSTVWSTSAKSKPFVVADILEICGIDTADRQAAASFQRDLPAIMHAQLNRVEATGASGEVYSANCLVGSRVRLSIRPPKPSYPDKNQQVFTHLV
jgi:hypothetical protein